MKTIKKKKLQSKGWKIGAVSQFLGLSKKESKIVEQKISYTRHKLPKKPSSIDSKKLDSTR